MFKRDYTCPVLLCVTPSNIYFAYRTITLYGRPFQDHSAIDIKLLVTGLFRVRSPLLTESRLISFPQGT